MTALSLVLDRKDVFRWLLLPLVLAACILTAATDADAAKRFGGGKSFGSKPDYNTNYSKPVPPAPGGAGVQRQAQQPGQQPGQQAGQPAGGWASRMGGMGGMLGGLLMGGLLGSMFFGGGFGGIGLMDIVLLGAGLFLLMRVLRSRTPAPAAGGHAGAATYAPPAPDSASGPSAGSGWDGLGDSTVPQGPAMPAGFDEAEFLRGAKVLYGRMQDAWSRRDLEDIRSFTSQAVHAEIARQAAEDPTPGRVDVLHVDARVLEVRREGLETAAVVLFEGLLREDAAQELPTQVREVWHFRRDEALARPEWLLDGIQQLGG